MFSRAIGIFLVVLCAACSQLHRSPPTPSGLTIETSKGCSFDIALRPDLAPAHVFRVVELAKSGFYDGLAFHRVIDGFMAQTGDPTGTGKGGSRKRALRAEFSSAPFLRGTVGMALDGGNPDSGNSQFFIMYDSADWLDGKYTVWGHVDEAGMDCIDRIERGQPPQNPDRMVRVTVR